MLDRYTRPEIANQQATEQSRFNLSQNLKQNIGMKARHQNLDKILVREEEDEEEEDRLPYIPDRPLTPEEAYQMQMQEAAKRLGLKKIKMGDKAFFTKQSMADVMKNNSVSAPFNPVAQNSISSQNQAPNTAPQGQFFFDNVKDNQVNGVPQGYNDYENRQSMQAGQVTNSTPEQQMKDQQLGSPQWVPNANTSPAPLPEVKMNTTGKMGGEPKFQNPYEGMSQMKKQSAPLFYDPRVMRQDEVMYEPPTINEMNQAAPQQMRRGGYAYNGPVGGGEWIGPPPQQTMMRANGAGYNGQLGGGGNWEQRDIGEMKDQQRDLTSTRNQLQQMGNVDDLSPIDRIKYQRLKGDYNRKQKALLRQENAAGSPVQYSAQNQSQLTPRQQAYDRMNEARADMNQRGQSVGQVRRGFQQYRDAAADYADKVPFNTLNVQTGRAEGPMRANAIDYFNEARGAYDRSIPSAPGQQTEDLVNRQDYADNGRLVTQDPGPRTPPPAPAPWLMNDSVAPIETTPSQAYGGLSRVPLAAPPVPTAPPAQKTDEWGEPVDPSWDAPVKRPPRMIRPGEQISDGASPIRTSDGREANMHYSKLHGNAIPITKRTVRSVKSRRKPSYTPSMRKADMARDGAIEFEPDNAPDDGAEVSTGVMAPKGPVQTPADIEKQKPAPAPKKPNFNSKSMKNLGAQNSRFNAKFGGRYA